MQVHMPYMDLCGIENKGWNNFFRFPIVTVSQGEAAGSRKWRKQRMLVATPIDWYFSVPTMNWYRILSSIFQDKYRMYYGDNFIRRFGLSDWKSWGWEFSPSGVDWIWVFQQVVLIGETRTLCSFFKAIFVHFHFWYFSTAPQWEKFDV